MRLTVNGVPVRVIDRIEIVVDVAEEGESLIRGMGIQVNGGSLTIEPRPDDEASVVLEVDQTVHIGGGKVPGILFRTNDANPPLDLDFPSPIDGNEGSIKFTNRSGDDLVLNVHGPSD